MQGTIHLIALTDLAAAKSGSNPLMGMLPFILIAVVFYFLLIRPQRRRQQQQAQLQNQLVPGQRVMTTAGLFATVVALEDDAVVLEIAPGVEARFVKQAIGQVLDDSSADAADEADETDDAEPGDAPDATHAEADEAPAAQKDAAAKGEQAVPGGSAGALPEDAIEPKTEAKTAEGPAAAADDGERKAGDKPAS